MPKTRTPDYETRFRNFLGAIEKGKAIKGIKTDEELAIKSGACSPSGYAYHKANRFETLATHQLRLIIATAGVRGKEVCDFLEAIYE